MPSFSSSAGHSGGNAGEPHRGPQSKGTGAARSYPGPLGLRTGNSEGLETGGATQGSEVRSSAGKGKSALQSPTTAEFKGSGQLSPTDTGSARLLVSATRGDLRLGVQTEAFGRVTIQTKAQGGQLSAQLSLENAKESAALAVHLPAVEQKIVQQHGLNASVRLVGSSDGRGGAESTGQNQSGADRGDSERYRDGGEMRSRENDLGSLRSSQVADPGLLANNQSKSSRLDVTV
jgi:hypothetical protein